MSSGNYKQGGRQRIRGFVPHVQVGNGGLWGFFNRPKAPGQRASADFWCSKSGHLEQYVDLGDQSYAQGSKQHNGNPYMVSCEFEGYPEEPMTEAQINTGGRLIAWVLTDVNEFELKVNLVPGEEGITPHYVFGGGHTCPQGSGGVGPRLGQFEDLIASARQWLGQPKPNPHEEFDMVPGQCRDLLGRKWFFVVGTNRHLFARVPDTDPAVWTDLGGVFTSGVDAYCEDNGVLVVTGRAADGQLQQCLVFTDGNTDRPPGSPPVFELLGGHIFP